MQYPYVYKTSFAVPNTAKRSLREGARFKREGVKAGVSDYVILYPSGPYRGLGGDCRPDDPRGRDQIANFRHEADGFVPVHRAR